jgi:glycosyltransferase involved in cell wall biosynthesis
MRIAFVHPRYPSAEGTGATYDATQIVSGLAEAGHKVCVYCAREPEGDPVDDRLELRYFGGHSSHPHTPTRQNRDLLARRDELREHDILHSYSMPLIPAVAEIGDGADVGTVVTLNAYGGTCPKNDLRYLNREPCRSRSTMKCLHCIARTSGTGDENGYLYEGAGRLFSLRLVNRTERLRDCIDRFQAISPHVRDAYAAFGYDPTKMRVIPNILDPQFDRDHETTFEPPYRLLYAGALSHAKGVDRLPEILSRVRARADEQVSLTVVGEGDLETALRREVRDRELSDVVNFAGWLPYEELPGRYASHDAFLYPGRWDEPFGRVFIEAMATGTPVVSTDVGSVATILGDAGVVTEQSVDALAETVCSMLDTETLREHSTAGRQRRDEYRSATIIPAFEELYGEILQ